MSGNCRWSGALLALLLALSGCGGSDPREDADVDASDGGSDADPDASLDAGEDAEEDAELVVIDPCIDPPALALDTTVFGTTMGGSATGPIPDYSACFAGAGADGAFTFEVDFAVPIEIVANADFDSVLSVRTDCRDPDSTLVCRDSVLMPGGEKVEFYAEPGTTYYVLVDGYRGYSSGEFSLRAQEKFRYVGLGEACNGHSLICEEEYDCDDYGTRTCILERCENLRNDDGDRIPDCYDDNCRDTPECAPGDGQLNDPCNAHRDCSALGEAPACLAEPQLGFPNGICTAWCGDEYGVSGACPSGSTCITIAPDDKTYFFEGWCLPSCTTDEDCPDGKYRCTEIPERDGEGTSHACFPYCESDDDCPVTHACNDETWRCAPRELCDGGGDEDNDWRVDCEDLDCSSLPVCVEARATACASPASLELGINHGTTAGASRLFSDDGTPGCANFSGPEQIWHGSFGEAGERGLLFLWLRSIPSQAMYIRSSCEAVPDLMCIPPYVIGDQIYSAQYTGGDPLWVYVDAEGADQVGPYTLEARYAPLVAIEPNNEPDQAIAYVDGSFGGEINPAGDVDYVRVHVDEDGSTLVASLDTLGGFECRSLSGSVDPQLEILSAEGTRSLAFDDDIGIGDLCPRATATDLDEGDYLVRISWSEGHPINALFPEFATFTYLLDVEVTP